MFTFIIFIAVLAVLVLSHEFGHFIVARRNGMGVEEFGFGFPPRLVGIRRVSFAGKKQWQVIRNRRQLEETAMHEHAGTIYSINLIPLGGFVRIKGEDPNVPGANDPDSFLSKKTWQKAGVVAAGVIMNVLLTVLLLSLGYMIGMPQVGDEASPNSELQIVQVVPGRPAEVAGLHSGAKIISVHPESNPSDVLTHSSVTNFQKFVNDHRDETLVFTISENGKEFTKNIKPTILEGTNRAGIGVAIVNIGLLKYPWYRALYQGVVDTGKYLVMIFAGLWFLIAGLFHGASVEGQVAGPVGVAVLTGEAARLGFVYLLQLMALLSLNLAVVNILPIPALDGGRLFFIIWNSVFKRPVTPRVEQIIHTVGFFVLMALVVLITVNDVSTFKGTISLWWNKLFNF
jgi:regulator of sigma E protease